MWYEEDGSGTSYEFKNNEVSFQFHDGWPAPPFSGATNPHYLASTGSNQNRIMLNVFPKDSFWVGNIGLSRYSRIPKDATIFWTVYLRNTQPIEGNLKWEDFQKLPLFTGFEKEWV
jgi:hypothetical protein